MKSLPTKTMLAAAALVVATGAASAQSLKADIPFAFRISGTVMVAGTYEVNTTGDGSGSRMLRLWNADTHQSVLALPSYLNLNTKWDGAAKLVFECGGGPCALIEVWNGSPSIYTFIRPKRGRHEETYLAVIPLRHDQRRIAAQADELRR